MAVCLKELLNFEGNIYEITNAVFRRAKQITEIGDEDLLKHSGKAVPTAIEQIFTEKVAYRIEE